MVQQKTAKKAKHWLIGFCVLALVKFLRVLPRSTAVSVMRGMALSAFSLMRTRRSRALSNLTMAFGCEKSPSEIQRIARQTFLNFGTFAADAIRIPQIVEKGMDKLITVEGLENLDGLSRDGRGAILLTAHFSNWELLGAWFAGSGYKIKVVGAPHSNARVNQMIVEARNRAGYENIERGSNTREILRALAKGYSIGMLIDQDTRVESVFVKFFNRWAHTPAGPVKLARKYGLKIIPIFIRLTKNDTYHIEVKEPLPLVFTGDKTQDLIVNTQICSDAYEQIVRRYPEQWLWMMRRWKKQPDANGP